jgi:hypothetical protein
MTEEPIRLRVTVSICYIEAVLCNMQDMGCQRTAVIAISKPASVFYGEPLHSAPQLSHSPFHIGESQPVLLGVEPANCQTR